MIETSCSKQWMLRVMMLLFLAGSLWMPVQANPIVPEQNEQQLLGQTAVVAGGIKIEQEFRVGRGKARRQIEYNCAGPFQT